MTEPVRDPFSEVLERARALLGAIDDPPDIAWVGAGEWTSELVRLAKPLREAIDRHHDKHHPHELRLLPAWIVAASEGQAWWCRLGHTSGAFVTDGRGILIVDSCGDAPQECSVPRGVKAEAFRDRFAAHRTIQALVDRARIGTRVSVRRDRIYVATRYLQLGPVVLDARRVARWVAPAARVAGRYSATDHSRLDRSIDITYGGELDAVLFEGEGWRALMMPMHQQRQADLSDRTVIETGASE